MEVHRASPPMMVSNGQAKRWRSRPSTSTKSAGGSPARQRSTSARRMARRVASRMPQPSISPTVLQPIPQAALALIAAASSRRCDGASCLLSRTCRSQRGRVSGLRTTAPATTGPASGPRPTSSTPATRSYPCAQSCSSRRRLGRLGGCRRRRGSPAERRGGSPCRSSPGSGLPERSWEGRASWRRCGGGGFVSTASPLPAIPSLAAKRHRRVGGYADPSAAEGSPARPRAYR